MSRDREPNERKHLVEVAEYSGEPAVMIAATQLGSDYSERRKRQIVDEWIAFFRSGPTPIRSLRLTSRTPKRLFDALSDQHQLTSLQVKWGDYDDLSALSSMSQLNTLILGGASKVRSLAHLAGLQRVETLEVEGLQGLIDGSPVGEMRAVKDLEIGGDWMAPRNVRLRSVAFLAQMPQLEQLLLHTLTVDDLDYTPLLSLSNLRKVRVMATRGMTPAHDELMRRLPWNG
ncbi:hypothetical protein ABZS29_13645 [Kribbella sp. NPDC005582]|uniref:hypothetical protein n=1 Tax=Kribbella sp. NPDC005582 TaxID=3156893 RepID=UPI0033A790F7